jgi:hypothetical protein
VSSPPHGGGTNNQTSFFPVLREMSVYGGISLKTGNLSCFLRLEGKYPGTFPQDGWRNFHHDGPCGTGQTNSRMERPSMKEEFSYHHSAAARLTATLRVARSVPSRHMTGHAHSSGSPSLRTGVFAKYPWDVLRHTSV